MAAAAKREPAVRTAAPAHLARGRPATPGDLLLQRRYRLLAPFLPTGESRLLDCGCGNGAQTFLLSPHFAAVLGVELELLHARAFQERAAALRISDHVRVAVADGQRLPCRNASFDWAAAFEVIEHVPDEGNFLNELHRILRPGGRLVLSAPNRWWIFETHGADLPLLRWQRVPFFSWLPRRLHDRWARARIYTRGDLRRLLPGAGFRIEHECYLTAPLDVLRIPSLQSLLRRTLFHKDRTRCPFGATAILVVARRD
jgi:SAM-dependent methyltransferase